MASHSTGDEAARVPTNSLDRAIEILDLLRGYPKGLTHAELCRLLGLPSSTCSYITGRLERRGYLRREEESRRFCLGLKMVSLARGALHGLGFRSVAEPVLYKVTAEAGLSVGIGIAQGVHVLLVDRVDGPDVIGEVVTARRTRVQTRENREIGRELPFHTTALGKVLLANMPSEELERLLPKLRFPRRTRASIHTEEELRRQLEQVQEQGFAIAEEEHAISVRALAVPLRDATGQTRAALSLNGRPDAEAWRDQARLVSLMESAAREIGRNLY